MNISFSDQSAQILSLTNEIEIWKSQNRLLIQTLNFNGNNKAFYAIELFRKEAQKMLDAKARYVAMVAEIENCNFQNFFTVRSSDEEVMHQILLS